MIDDRGWTSSQYDLNQVRLMFWISSHPGSDFGQFIDESDVDPAVVEAISRVLASQGMINLAPGLGGVRSAAGFLEGPGQTLVHRMIERHQDLRSRRVASRDALLDWFADQELRGATILAPRAFAGDVRAHYFGDPFTLDEINRAGNDLMGRGLLRGKHQGDGEIYLASITPEGQRAAELFDSSVQRYESPSEAATFNTINVGGDNYGQVGAGNVNQQQTVGADPEAFARLVSDLRTAMDALPIEDQVRGQTYVDMLEEQAEAGADADRGVLRASGRGLRALADKVSTSTVGVGVDALWAYLKSRYDLPDL